MHAWWLPIDHMHIMSAVKKKLVITTQFVVQIGYTAMHHYAASSCIIMHHHAPLRIPNETTMKEC